MADYAIHDTTLIGTSNIIRKKEGSSALIDPADYPKRINLMGLLEEKTASGSIVTFSDGADDVPLKSCEVALPASLDGYSSVDAVQTGKNLLINNGADISGSGLSFVVNSDKSVTISGVATANAFFTFFENVLFKASPYMIRGSGNSNVQIIVRRGTASGSNIRTASTSDISWNLAENTLCACVIRVASGTDLTTPITVYPQIEVGSSLSDYETAIFTSYTVNLGRTIYGGTADVVKGEGQETYGKKVFDGTEGTGGTPAWTMISVSQGTMFRITVSDKVNTSATNTLCSCYTPVAQAQRADGTVSGAGTNVDIIDNRFSSVDEFKAWLSENPVTLVYETATSTDFTFSPVEISSRLGNNTMWSDSGDTEVTYRASGTVTPVVPTLISKTITANGTYSAEDDGADGYDEVVVNVPSIQSIAVHSGKLNIKNGTITADADYCYTDEIECPDGWMRMDFGETSNGDFIGLEMLDNGMHNNYLVANDRFRSINLSSYYSATKTIRLAFRKTYEDVVVFIDYSHSKLYSPFTMLSMQEASAPSLLSMSPSEEVNENTEEVEENEQNESEG